VRRQIEATGKRQIIFLDNNVYGNDRQYYFDRVEMLADLKRRGAAGRIAPELAADLAPVAAPRLVAAG
jgi:hypothetical protein